MNRTLQITLFGAVGGFLGFLLSEWLGSGSTGDGFFQLMLNDARWTGLFMLPLTVALVAADNLLGLRGRWTRGLAAIIVPALVLGAFSGALGQALYGAAAMTIGTNSFIRALAWAVSGLGIGLLLGLPDRSWKKAWRGAVGGTIGGFIGGLIFNSLALIHLGENDTGTVARLVGLTIQGAAIGFMLQLAQEFFKSAWLMGTNTGKYEGKQYILSKARVTVGRSDGNDISFYHDETVPMQAGAFVQQGKSWQWQGEPILVNRQPRTNAELQSGDRLTFGQTELVFQQKGAVAATGRVPVPPLELTANNQRVHFPANFRQVTLGTQGQLRLQGAGIQPQHAVITAQPDGTLHLQAHAPLEVNDQLLSAGATTPLRPGDLLKLGDTEFALIKSELVPVER